MWSSLNTWFRITLLIQTNWFHCIFLRDLATSWSNNVSTWSSQPGLLSYYDDVLTCGTQGQGCSASWVLHSTVLHGINLWSWAHRTYCIPYFSLPPTHTSCSRLAAYPLCLSFNHARLRLLRYLCRFCFLCSCPAFSSGECLLTHWDSAQAPALPGSLCLFQTQTGISGTFICVHPSAVTCIPMKLWLWVYVVLSLLLDWNLLKNKLDVPRSHRVPDTYWALHKDFFECVNQPVQFLHRN